MSVLVTAKFPSVAAVFMAFAASLLLLFLARIVFFIMRLWYCPLTRADGQEKISMFSLSSFPKSRSSSWQWSGAPAPLPLTFRIPEKPASQAHHAVRPPPKRSASLPVAGWLQRPSAPQFQPPSPALYDSPVPLSMAKLIMSRHTFRKPNPSRSRRTSIASSSKQPVLPPQTPSRLYHSMA